MKRQRESRIGVQERTAMRDKNMHREQHQSLRPYPSKDTITPNRGINEDAQKQRTNQEEEDQATNARQSSEQDRNQKEDKRNTPE